MCVHVYTRTRAHTHQLRSFTRSRLFLAPDSDVGLLNAHRFRVRDVSSLFRRPARDNLVLPSHPQPLSLTLSFLLYLCLSILSILDIVDS